VLPAPSKKLLSGVETVAVDASEAEHLPREVGEVEEQRVTPAGEQEHCATDESGERSRQRGPQAGGHPRAPVVTIASTRPQHRLDL
jgi:hypothetical protein